MNRNIFRFILVLVILAFCISSVSAYKSIKKVPPEKSNFSAGNTVKGGILLVFNQDFSTTQSLVFTTDLENPHWNQSIYIVDLYLVYSDWHLLPESADKNLIVSGMKNQTHFIDAVFVEVEGVVPDKPIGSSVSVIKVSRFENAATLVPGASEEIVQNINDYESLTTPLTPSPQPSLPTARPVTKQTPKSPAGLIVPFIAIALGIAGSSLRKTIVQVRTASELP